MNPQMDNDVINLAKAIRQTESGGDFNAKGASGESGGYQWMPQTWKAHAKQALGDENAEMTPSNQNAVAYTVLKSWKDEGLNPAQIAARWNSGSEKGWENKVGVNSAGVKYDVPKYVKSVTDAYQKVKDGAQVGIDPNNPSANPQMAETPKEGGGFMGFLKNVALDPIKTLLATPAARAAEVVGRSGLLGEKIKTGYEEMQKEGAPLDVLGMQIEQQRGGTSGLKQIGGEALKTGSYLYGGGAAPGAVKTTLGGAMGQGAKQIGKLGAQTGAMYGAGEEMTKKESTLGSIAGAGALGGVVGGVTGGVLGAATPLAVRALSPAQRLLRRQQAADEAVGRVLQGKPKDRAIGERAFREIDTEGVKTNQELRDRVDEKITDISEALDRTLETNPLKKTLDTLSYTTTVDGQTVTHNYVKEGLDQLEAYYTKVGDYPKLAAIRQLRNRATTEGLTVKEINDIARVHGQDLNAYNLNGELATGLAKQTAENTRNGLKSTSRSLFGNKIAQDADKTISDLIRVRGLVDKQIEAVNKLQQRTQAITLGQRATGLVENVVDIATLGLARGLIRTAMRGGRLAGNRLDAMALEAQLAKNLKLIREASDTNATEQTIIKKLEEFIRNNGTKKMLALPAKGQSSYKINLPKKTQSTRDITEGANEKIFTTAKGYPRVGTLPIKGETQVKKLPITDKANNYYPPKLPTIQAGRVPKTKSNLPVAKELPNVFSKPKKVDSIADVAYKNTVKNGGVTLSLEGNMPTKGIAYAPFKDTEFVIPKKDLTPQVIEKFMDTHADKLNVDGNHLGMWEDDGKIYLDISRVGEKTSATFDEAAKAQQLGLFDLESYETIPLGEIKNGVYTKLYETSNHPYFNKRKNKRAGL